MKFQGYQWARVNVNTKIKYLIAVKIFAKPFSVSCSSKVKKTQEFSFLQSQNTSNVFADQAYLG
jgi:hypothetical protein